MEAIERCSGHDGTYAIKHEYRAHSVKIARPVANKVKAFEPDHFGSDCAMAGHHIEHVMGGDKPAQHPITLIRTAYGI